MFTAADGSPVLAFAGLCGRWRDAVSGDDISSCTIVVSGACAWMTPYHDRMPVLFEAKDFDMARRIASSRRAESGCGKGFARVRISPRLSETEVGDDKPNTIEPLGA